MHIYRAGGSKQYHNTVQTKGRSTVQGNDLFGEVRQIRSAKIHTFVHDQRHVEACANTHIKVEILFNKHPAKRSSRLKQQMPSLRQ